MDQPTRTTRYCGGMAAGKTVTLRFDPAKALGRTGHGKEGLEQYNREAHEYHVGERRGPFIFITQPEQQNGIHNKHGGREDHRDAPEKYIQRCG